jgi:hypothetical protein
MHFDRELNCKTFLHLHFSRLSSIFWSAEAAKVAIKCNRLTPKGSGLPAYRRSPISPCKKKLRLTKGIFRRGKNLSATNLIGVFVVHLDIIPDVFVSLFQNLVDLSWSQFQAQSNPVAKRHVHPNGAAQIGSNLKAK